MPVISKLTMYTDGAARGNPGPAGIGVVISDETGLVVREFGEAIGEATNNVAEYTALIRGLQEAAVLGAKEVRIFLDSELVVKQLKGEYRVKNAGLKGLHAAALEGLGRYERTQITHVPRERNKDADRLANEALDRELDGEIKAAEPEEAPGQGSLF